MDLEASGSSPRTYPSGRLFLKFMILKCMGNWLIFLPFGYALNQIRDMPPDHRPRLNKLHMLIVFSATSLLGYPVRIYYWTIYKTKRERWMEEVDYAFQLGILFLIIIMVEYLPKDLISFLPVLTGLFLWLDGDGFLGCNPHTFPLICKGYGLIIRHKKQAFQAVLLALEVISYTLDQNIAEDKKDFLNAILFLSIGGFAWTVIPPTITYFKIRRMQQAGSQQGIWMEVFLSLVQLLTAIPPVTGSKSQFDPSELLPLMSATMINLLYCLQEDTIGNDTEQMYVSCPDCCKMEILHDEDSIYTY